MPPGAPAMRQYPQEQNEAWQEVEDEEEPALYATDDFRIRVMKVIRCSKKYCHDWTRCPFAHPGEKATRRDPKDGVYTGIACPDMRRDQRCPRGHYCPYAHNVFEYWLHPTRYRTALCRDVDRCTRKICFFAHNMQEIRSNLERPYVSPEQLLAATQAAAADPRVQAKYLAAGEQKGARQNIFSGIEDDDLDHPDQFLPNLSSLTLAAPPSNPKRAETMNAFSSMIRGSPELNDPEHALAQSLRGSGTGGTRPSATAESSTLPGGSLSDTAMEGGSRATDYNAQLGDDRLSSDTSHLSSKKAFQTQSKPLRTHLSSAGNAIHSWGSQQNLLNAAAHLSSDKTGRESALWSTPRGPLDLNPLYTSSDLSDRNTSIDSVSLSNRPLDMKFGQRMRRGKPARRQSNTSLGHASLTSYNPSNTFTGSGSLTGASYLGQQSLNTASSAGTYGFAPDPLPTYQGLYSDSLHSGSIHSDYAQMLQREQAYQQQPNYFGMQQQQQQSVQSGYEQQLREQQARQRLQNSLGQGMGNPMMGIPLAEELRRRETAAQQVPETGFDLRFGGLGEHQGVLTQPPIGRPSDQANLQSKLYSAHDPELHALLYQDPVLGRLQPATSHSYPGSLNASILQALQAHGMRGNEAQGQAADRRRSAENLSNAMHLDMDLANRLGFSNTPFGRSPPNN